MNRNRRLAMIVAYYLSRFDKEGVTKLGYGTLNQAFEDISEILDVKRNTLKNWRDEFDPIHPFRKGWYQRPMSPSRVRVVEALQDLDEFAIRQIVIEIINNTQFRESAETDNLTSFIGDEVKPKRRVSFILRGPTGKKAEDYFVNWFNSSTEKPISGKLTDMRYMGCGYDYEITSGSEKNCIEVKGLASDTGGILFTNKEWVTAIEKEDKYFLALVSNLDKKPLLTLIQNPARKLRAEKKIYTTIQISWTIGKDILRGTK